METNVDETKGWNILKVRIFLWKLFFGRFSVKDRKRGAKKGKNKLNFRTWFFSLGGEAFTTKVLSLNFALNFL